MMRKLVNWALAAMLWAVQAQALTPVITPDELLDLLDDPSVVVLDIRNRASWGFDSGHIPGAVSSPYADWRSIPRTADGSLDDAAVSDLVQRAGLTADSKVVIVHTGLNRRSLSSAAWVYWILRSAGLTELSILEGGAKVWRDEGLPETTQETRASPSAYTVALSDTFSATLDDVRAVLSGEAEGRLLDSEAQILLDTRVSVRTTLSAAEYIDSFSLFATEGALVGEHFLVLEKLKFSPLDWEYTPVIMFSETLPLAALNWFMASEVAGIRNVRLLATPSEQWVQLGSELDQITSVER